MDSALCGIYGLIVLVSDNSCVNTVCAHFPWSNLYFSNFINNSSSLNKGNHDRDNVWIFRMVTELSGVQFGLKSTRDSKSNERARSLLKYDLEQKIVRFVNKSNGWEPIPLQR